MAQSVLTDITNHFMPTIPSWKNVFPKPESYANQFSTFVVVRLAPNPADPDHYVQHGPINTIPLAYIGQYERFNHERQQRWEWCYSSEYWAMEAAKLTGPMTDEKQALQDKITALQKVNESIRRQVALAKEALTGV